MKKIIVLFLLVSITGRGFSQLTKDSTEMVKRLELFMQFNRDMNLDKIIEYTYPKLFTITPKEQIREVLESFFDSEELSVKMDSLTVEKIYPLITSGDNRYSRITYSMLVRMNPKNEKLDPTALLKSMQESLGADNVRLNDKKTGIIIYQKVDMVGVRDELSPSWTFMNLKRDDPMTEQLLDKKIVDKLYSY